MCADAVVAQAALTPAVFLAAPRAKLPQRRVDIACRCGAKLFRYAKGNGAGSRLVAARRDRPGILALVSNIHGNEQVRK